MNSVGMGYFLPVGVQKLGNSEFCDYREFVNGILLISGLRFGNYDKSMNSVAKDYSWRVNVQKLGE